MDLPPTPVSTLERALEIGRQAGLKFIYTGNVPGHDGENTRCYQCGKIVVERSGYDTRVTGLQGSKCKYCGTDLNFRREANKDA
jgi:pyruvate formate lyase activating enzyme